MDSFRHLNEVAERCYLKMLGVYKTQPPVTNNPVLRALGDRYDIRFVTSDEIDCADLSYRAPSNAQLKMAETALADELHKYPMEAVRRSMIEQIILCRNLLVNSKRAAGTLRVGLQHIDTLFIDVSSFKIDDLHARRTFHHEMFHAIDFRDTLMGYIDPDWRKIQGEDYKYQLDLALELHSMLGDNPVSVQSREFDDPYHWLSAEFSESPGFVSEYAKYSVVEDKAELFCHLMVSYNRVMSRCKWDDVLARKVERMKHLLLAFCPELNDQFWMRQAESSRSSENGQHPRR